MQIGSSSLRCALNSLCVVTVTLASVQVEAQSPWRVLELRGPEGTFTAIPFSVDRFRNVYGQAQMSVGGIRPVKWMAANNYAPEFVGTQDGYIRGSNGKGQFVGLQEMTVAGPSGKAILWAADGSSQFLEGLPEYRRADGVAINATSMVAGSIITQDFAWRAFRWRQGEAVVIPSLADYPYAFGTGLSDNGFVVGYGLDNYNPVTKMAGWLWSPTGGVQKLPSVGSFYKATGVNNTGLVCGSARLNTYGTAVVWPVFGAPIMLTALSGFPHADAVAVNDAGWVAGNSWTGKWNQRTDTRPVVWMGGEAHDIVAESGVAGLKTAYGINYRGDVIGQGLFEGRNSGFIALRRIQ